MTATKDIVTAVLGSSVGAGGTFTMSYPTNKTRLDYLGTTNHELTATGMQTLFAASGQFSLTFGASDITVTLLGGYAITANSRVWLHIDRAALDPGEVYGSEPDARVTPMGLSRIALGVPATAGADGFFASQNLTSAGVASVSVTVAAAIAAAALAGTADVARNVVAAWTGTAVITITGTDEYGNVVVESSGSGTSLTGKKAFKTVTGIAVSGNVTSLTVGTGVLLGLPVFLPTTSDVLREQLDGATATAGTLAAADLTAVSATTGDVRGTYSPNSAPNGSRRFELIAALRNPYYRGASQFAG